MNKTFSMSIRVSEEELQKLKQAARIESYASYSEFIRRTALKEADRVIKDTMNSASAGKTYIKMQDQLLKDDDCACYLVEAIAKKSQNIKWETSVNGNKVSHKRIRRVSIDQFYSLVTGEADAFYQICMVLPDVISDVIKDGSSVSVPKDTVLEELSNIAKNMDASSEELSMAMAIYLLGFSSYSGFTKSQDENMINRIYEYAKRINKI